MIWIKIVLVIMILVLIWQCINARDMMDLHKYAKKKLDEIEKEIQQFLDNGISLDTISLVNKIIVWAMIICYVVGAAVLLYLVFTL